MIGAIKIAWSFLTSRTGLYVIGAIAAALLIWWVTSSLIDVGVQRCEAEHRAQQDEQNTKANQAGGEYEQERKTLEDKLAAAEAELADLRGSHPLTCRLGPERLRILNRSLTDPRQPDAVVPFATPLEGR